MTCFSFNCHVPQVYLTLVFKRLLSAFPRYYLWTLSYIHIPLFGVIMRKIIMRIRSYKDLWAVWVGYKVGTPESNVMTSVTIGFRQKGQNATLTYYNLRDGLGFFLLLKASYFWYQFPAT